MSIYNIISVIGGLAFFLFGMNVLSSGLKKVAGDKLEGILHKMTDHPLKGLILGAIITIAMQSSSALTVMLVGLVNSGIMTLVQTVGIIMGSNIGTTLTAWILSLSGVETDNFLLSMMKPENFSPIIALIGVILIMAAREQKHKDIGNVMIGFAVLMQGMEMMSNSLSPLAEVPEFTSILTAFKNPFLGVLIGMLFTGIIQSSAASVGVLQALSLTGQISYGVAIPIIMGQNIGTCVTALLSSIGVSKNAKRVSVIHVSFNLIGTVIGLVVYLVFAWIIRLPVLDETMTPFAIAAFHSVFNVVTTLILLPFSNQLVIIAKHVIKEDGAQAAFLDERLLLSPALATSECRNKTVMVMNKSVEGYCNALAMLNEYNRDQKDNIKQLEEEVDDMVDSCNSFLIRLSEKDVSKKDSATIAEMLHDLGDMERISDYSIGISKTIKKINRDDFAHKKELCTILEPINNELTNLLTNLYTAYENVDVSAAEEVLYNSGELVSKIKKTKKSNLRSLKDGKAAAEASVYFSDYLTICRRVAEHSENIAETLCQ
ncbi:MAG: Na/Pi cotransporter family protein [Lachnospiraceae bacterium]|nr:Na/Pi cotransporter family protein [Lachnospiraceae bacterium]